jgi:hypothetical protein
MIRRSFVFLALAACGGAAGASKDPNAPTRPTQEDSIGQAAIQQGGMASLGEAATEGAPALASSLQAILIEKKKVKLDGMLGEWPARTAATTVVEGTPGKLSFAGAVQYDDNNLYIACETNDPKQDAKDHCSLTLAFPGAGGALVGHEVAFFPGKPGVSEGRVLFAGGSKKGQPVSGAKIVEAPRTPGLSIEAILPWATFPEARTARVGLRGVLNYFDAGANVILSTGPGDLEHTAQLPALPTEPEQALIEGLLEPRGLTARAPKVDLYADVSGDPMKERVSVFDNFFTIVGHNYRAGKEFFFRDLGSAELVRLEARDLTGEGKDDLLVRRRFASNGGTREWLEIWQIGPSDEPITVFAHEIAIARGNSRVANSVHLRGKEIEIALEPAVGWDAASYHEATNADVEPALLPWGAVRSQTYRLEGGKFIKAGEVAQKPEAPKGQQVASTAPAPPAIHAGEPPTPPQSKGGDLSKQLFEQFKRDRNIAADVAPTTDIQVNVAEDPRPERVILVGNEIVVFGPGFKGGNEYAFISLPQFASPGSVKDLTARDLNGDGAADLVVRGSRVVQPKQGSTPEVVSEATFAYELKGGAIQRIFAIETAREQGKDRVQGLVQFVPAKSGKGFDFDVRPGRATGWNEKSYPWQQEKPGTGSVEPVLLPWGGIPNLRYTWNGTQFVTK